jgi:UDP-galactopyranose mutase
MYDLLIVGAGITAATLVAQLKDQLRICVVDCRKHLGGNCFDESASGSYVHRYGPHIFHCPSPRIVAYLSQYTEWIPYTHTVVAEVFDAHRFHYVPFPYCRKTAQLLGRELSDDQVTELFFRSYSQKMWGMPWDQLPSSITRRIPRKLTDLPVYYRDDFVALPRLGYTHMIENMLDGGELILGAPSDEWTKIAAETIVYTGRPDLIPRPGESVSIGERENLQLQFRTLDIDFAAEQWPHDAISLHACTLHRAWTRKTSFARMTGGTSPIVSTEFPHQAHREDLTPYYPIESADNRATFAKLSDTIKACYPSLHLAGRLGSYRYFDMYQAVGQAMALTQRLYPSAVQRSACLPLAAEEA